MSFSKEQIMNLLKNEPYKLGHFLGYKDLTELHNDWLKDWLYSSKDSTTQAHRGSYKTTDLAVFLAVNALVHPRENVIFLRKTDTDVTEVIRLVVKIMKSGAYIEMCKALYGIPAKVLKDTASEIHTNLYKGKGGASQIVGMGINGSLTGKHADVIVTDDIINIKDRISKAERDHTKLIYQELQNVLNRGGRIINTGTPWHKDDAFSLMPNIKKYDCYTTGLMTEEQIMHLRNSMSPSLFSANYELKHIADEDALFTNAQFTKELPMDGIAHIDAGYGGEDSTALTILCIKDGNFIVYGKKYQKHVDDCLADILRLKAKYRTGTTWCEKNADKGYLAKELKNHGDLAQTYHERMNKHIKISTYLKENWGRVYFTEDTDPEYIAEVLDYSEHAQHDDCPDSLASAIRQMGKKPMTLNKGVHRGL
jgi:phage terminase large subunit-like protein